ncbi:MAG: hypothetical protein IPK32_14225 [Verrucomicrobiaceae bacterium]|nr:hypothetical protein [Verrucomicrobiaceae bacterium]
MKSFISLVFAVFMIVGIASAQNIHGLPFTPVLGPAQPSGLFGRLLDEPHVIEVSKVSSGGRESGNFSIVFNRYGQPSVTMTQQGHVTFESIFVSNLVTGGKYRIPQSVVAILGHEATLQIIRGHYGEQISDLRDSSPFRAVVWDQGIGESTYSIVLQEASGRLHHLKGLMEDKATRAIAAHLIRGRSFEFPAVLDDALRTPEQRNERAKPKNAATAVLQRYLGKWRGALDDNPKATVEMSCYARPDGSGIWREITFNDGSSDIPPVPDVTIVEYSNADKTYHVSSRAPGGLPPLHSTWDENTRTFTTVMPVEDLGLKRVNTATFTREDRIDWKTTTKNQKEEIIATNGGHYDRIFDTTDVPDSAPTRITDGEITVSQPALSVLPKVDFSSLSSSPPFRARVTAVKVTEDSVSAKFVLINDYEKNLNYSAKGVGASPIAKSLAQLKEGTIYEFPYCLHHLDGKPANGPTTPAMRELAPFIGVWKVRVRDRWGVLQESPLRIRYFWSADGTFIWREQITPNSGLLEYARHDKDTDRYVCACELFETDVKKNNARWDAASRSYTTELTLGSSPPGTVRAERVRTFKTDDLVEWHNKEMNADGKVVHETSGIFERIK